LNLKVQPVWKSVQRFLKILIIALAYGPATPRWGMCCGREVSSQTPAQPGLLQQLFNSQATGSA
jgi:hypothetical protein